MMVVRTKGKPPPDRAEAPRPGEPLAAPGRQGLAARNVVVGGRPRAFAATAVGLELPHLGTLEFAKQLEVEI